MDLSNKKARFLQRWNITDDTSPESKFQAFKNSILNAAKEIDSFIGFQDVEKFCSVFGIRSKWNVDTYGDGRKYGWNVYKKLESDDSLVNLAASLEMIFYLDIKKDYNRSRNGYDIKGELFTKVSEAISLSGAPLSLAKNADEEVIFYPKGETLLDNEIVDKALLILGEQSNSHFVDALKFYQSQRWIKSAESVRRCLEEFLKEKFNNEKGLQNNKEELLKGLKSNKSDAQIRNIISQIVSYLDQYFNENSKHNDGELGEPENEFLIYQIGLLIRYIDKAL